MCSASARSLRFASSYHSVPFRAVILFAALFLVAPAPPPALASCPDSSGVKIDEVFPDASADPVGGSRHPRVELFNRGATAVEVTGWQLVDRTGASRIVLPEVTLPASAYLIVHLATGSADLDFTDGTGTVYSNGDSTELGRDDVELGLYSGAPSSETLVDFVAWSLSGVHTLGVPGTHATSTGQWPGTEFVPVGDDGLSTLARSLSGYDCNVPADWSERPWNEHFARALTPATPRQISPGNGLAVPAGAVTFCWAPFPAAGQYLLEVGADSLLSSLVGSTVTPDTCATLTLAPGRYFWRIQVQIGTTYFPVATSAVWVVLVVGPTPPPPPLRVLLAVPHLFQHKDSGMLCLSRDSGKFLPTPESLPRPGCTEMAGPEGPWDSVHPDEHAKAKCDHCGWYCVRASIAMINHFYGGDLSQDRISYEVISPNSATYPEFDLGHGRGMWGLGAVEEIGSGLSWALSGKAINVTAQTLGVTTLMGEINAGRPLLIIIPGHAMVADGFDASTSPPQIHIEDPWPGGQTGWNDLPTAGIIGYYRITAGAVAARLQEASVTTDSDGDGVVDFDETQRFFTLVADPDTDHDQVPDKQDIRSYVFHDTDHPGHGNDALSFADIDGDDLRSERDCDSDNDGDSDGCEDIDGDGDGGVGPNETDVFLDTQHLMSLTTDQAVYLIGETVKVLGSSYHHLTNYGVEVGGNCPTKPNHSGLAPTVIVSSDQSGDIPPQPIFVCPYPGIFYGVLDVGNDLEYRTPDNHDPQVCWQCLYNGWGTPLIDGSRDLAYGLPKATDRVGDGNGNAVMDLGSLYVVNDATYWYFFFTVNADVVASNWGKYVLYLDTDGASGSGATLDAWGRNVAVLDPHKPEYSLNSWVDGGGVYSAAKTQLWQWTGGAWTQPGSADDAALEVSSGVSGIEWKIARSRLGDPHEIWCEVWSTGGGGSDNAQDTANFPAEDWNAADWVTQSILDSSTHLTRADGVDVTPPTVSAAGGLGAGLPDSIAVSFSEPVDRTSAESIANYTVSGGVSVLAANRSSADSSLVILCTTALPVGPSLSVRVYNVMDRAGNVIVNDDTTNVACFALAHVVMRAHMNLHLRTHSLSPNTVGWEGGTAPLTWTPTCDFPLVDADGDSVFEGDAYFTIPVACATSAGATTLEFKLSHGCTEWESIPNRVLDLAVNTATDSMDIWWNDISPMEFTTRAVDVVFRVDVSALNPQGSDFVTLNGDQIPLNWNVPSAQLLRDDGMPPDSLGSDGIYSARIRFPAATYRQIQYKFLFNDIYECLESLNRATVIDDAGHDSTNAQVLAVDIYSSCITGIETSAAGLSRLLLAPIAPTPSRGSFVLFASLPQASFARITLVDVGGRIVRELMSESRQAGPVTVHWDGRDAAGQPVPRGVYFATLEAAGQRTIRRVVLLR